MKLQEELPHLEFSFPKFKDEAEKLAGQMKKLTPIEMATVMKTNEKLTRLNHKRFQNWSFPNGPEGASAAILAFSGDAYRGLQAWTFNKEDFSFAQSTVRILSGLHGILRPLDLIRPYRMEMGLKWDTPDFNNLYDFWGDKITAFLNNELKHHDEKIVLNLASEEYFKAIHKNKLDAEIVTASFKEEKNGKYRPVHVFLKRARGMMTNYIVKNKIKDMEQITGFDQGGYFYNRELSGDGEYVFTR
jgi:hypothetical protein